jgi:hypothetical protein
VYVRGLLYLTRCCAVFQSCCFIICVLWNVLFLCPWLLIVFQCSNLLFPEFDIYSFTGMRNACEKYIICHWLKLRVHQWVMFGFISVSKLFCTGDPWVFIVMLVDWSIAMDIWQELSVSTILFHESSCPWTAGH